MGEQVIIHTIHAPLAFNFNVLDAVSALIIMEDVKIVMYVCPSPRNAYKPAKPPHYIPSLVHATLFKHLQSSFSEMRDVAIRLLRIHRSRALGEGSCGNVTHECG